MSRHASRQFKRCFVGPRAHFVPGTAHNAQPLFLVELRIVFEEPGKVPLQKHHAGHVFQQLSVVVFPQLTLGDYGLYPLALVLRVAAFRHNLRRSAAMHTAASQAPLVVVLAAFTVVAPGHGPALQVLGPAGNLYVLGRLRFQREQPAGHVQAVGVLPGQWLAINHFPVWICLVSLINTIQRFLQSFLRHSLLVLLKPERGTPFTLWRILATWLYIAIFGHPAQGAYFCPTIPPLFHPSGSPPSTPTVNGWNLAWLMAVRGYCWRRSHCITCRTPTFTATPQILDIPSCC